MLAALLVCTLTIAAMILCILFFPKLKLGKTEVSTYWLVTVIGAGILLAFGLVDGREVLGALTADTAVNPLKILVLFLSMTVLSVFLDELGFFRVLAGKALKYAHGGQKKLFFALYALVAVLTVFTSNDIIILSFTPFILYFSKHANIDPMPYLAAEFVAANTWSMALIIGNPTNIYLAEGYGLDFFTYLRLSAFPTVLAGMVALSALYFVYRKKLSMPISGGAEEEHVTNKPLLAVGLVHLVVCTVLLAVGSYLGLEMWIVALAAVGSLAVCALTVSLFERHKPAELLDCVRRAPYALIPFVLSMFVMIVALEEQGVTEIIAEALEQAPPVWTYGAASFVSANIINNIPMSVLFSAVLGTSAGLPALLATVIGSNIGAFLTPIGALAGIMWSSMLSREGVRFGYGSFLKMGVTVALPTLLAALGALALEFL